MSITPEIVDHFACLIASHQQDYDDSADGMMDCGTLRGRIEGYADAMRELARLCGIPLVTMEVKVGEYMDEHRDDLGYGEDEEDEG